MSYRRRLATAILLLLVVGASAIYEDEQGKFDWSLRLLGDVQLAITPDEISPEYIFLASTEGNVGAVKLAGDNAGQVVMRHRSTGVPRCLVSSTSYLLVVSDDGTVNFLDRQTFALLSTLQLSTDGMKITSASCQLKRGLLSVFAVTGGSVSLFEVDAQSNSGSAFSPTPSKISVTHAEKVLHSETDLFVSTHTSCTVYSRTTQEELETHNGQCVNVRDTEFILKTQGRMERRIVGVSTVPQTSVWACEECYYNWVNVPGVGTSKPAHFFSYVLPKGLMIDFSNHKINLPGAMEGSLVMLAFEDAEAKKTLILTKTHHGNLLMLDQDGFLQWERVEALASPAAAVILHSDDMDHFQFHKDIVVVTTNGVLYALPIKERGVKVRLLDDIGDRVVSKLRAARMRDVTLMRLKEVDAFSFQLWYEYKHKRLLVEVTLEEGAVVCTFQKDVLAVIEDSVITTELELRPPLETTEEISFFTVNVSKGSMRGYSIKDNEATPTWMVQLPSPFVAYATAEPSQGILQHNVRLFPNHTKEEAIFEVRHRYPMDNVVAVAHYERESPDELPTLVVTAVDTVTGSVHGTARHRNVEGDVKMLIVENSIVYYYLDAEKMRYCFGVWELFRFEEGSVITKDSGVPPPSVVASFFEKNNAVFSSRASHPPVVKVQSLGVYGGPIADMKVTHSYNSIARKNVVLAFESGRVGVVELNRLLRGRPMFFHAETLESQVDRTQILIPPPLYASHRYLLSAPKKLVVSPTLLESSSHIFVAGTDLFYVRSSSGKAFDLLNNDFNRLQVCMVIGGLLLAAMVARFFVKRKALRMAWQ